MKLLLEMTVFTQIYSMYLIFGVLFFYLVFILKKIFMEYELIF